MGWNSSNINELVGRTLTKVENNNELEIVFTLNNGDQYKLYHEQDCCESVAVEEVMGNLEDLVNSPILEAEEEIKEGENDEYDNSSTITIYNFVTSKGKVSIKWVGSSNGYYSEDVSFCKINNIV